MSLAHAKCVIFLACWWRYSLKILSTYLFFLFESCPDWWQALLLKRLGSSFSNALWVFFIALFFTLLLYCALFTAINNCPHHIMKCLCAWQYAACCLTRLQTPFSSKACELKCCCFSTRGQHMYCNPQTAPVSPSLHTPLNVNHIVSLHWHWQPLMNIEMSFILIGNLCSRLTFHTLCQQYETMRENRKLKLCFTSDFSLIWVME